MPCAVPKSQCLCAVQFKFSFNQCSTESCRFRDLTKVTEQKFVRVLETTSTPSRVTPFFCWVIILPTMQRWFFLEDPENALRRAAGDQLYDESYVAGSDLSAFPPRPWLFRVRVPELKVGETVCVTGNVPELGCWDPDKSVPLDQEDETEVWSRVINIPDKHEVLYRYCVCVVVESGLQVIVHNWETHLETRKIEATAKSPSNKDEPEAYGDYENMYRVDRGWLNKETIVQLKLIKNPLLWRPRYANRPVFIKVTPLNLSRYNTTFPKNMSEALEESLSTDNQDMLENPKFACTEVASLYASDTTFQPQEQFGKEFNSGDSLIFQSSVLFPSTIAFLIDLYVYSSRAVDGEPPYHAGFSYLLPSALQSSLGSAVLPVTSTKHRPLGQIELEYLVIRPSNGFKCDMEISYARHWKNTWCGLDVGHRGSGSSFKREPKNCAEVRENTLASLKTAIEHGADFVEFDVQLSKDSVPIIYHDYHVCISLKRKRQLEESDMLELPLKELTLEQLRLLKVYHLSEAKTKNPRFFDEDLEDHQPFPTLQHMLEVLDPHVGFNVEVKWTMQLQDGSYELNNPFDINMYVDTILDVILKYAGGRRIIFSSFHPDICTMLRFKQNKYPVMFLTIGTTAKYPQYHDPRCLNVEMAVKHAVMMELLGVNIHTEDLLRDPSQLRMATEAGLIVFCWGDDNADKATIKYLKELGLHGIIYDKIDQYSSKEVKESIFLMEARESQKELIRLAAANSELRSPSPPPPLIKERILDVDKARQNLDNISTATSLESLESHLSDYNTGSDT